MLASIKKILNILFFQIKHSPFLKKMKSLSYPKTGSNKIRDCILGHDDYSVMESKNEKN